MLALGVSTAAALTDWRTGQIPNWITVPPLVAAPLVLGLSMGPAHALLSVVSATLCGLVPYIAFRSGGMGGGDVKLFAALGASTGMDLSTGMRIQLVSLAIAAVGGVASLLVHTPQGERIRRFLSTTTHDRPPAPASRSIKLGPSVLLGTGSVLFSNTLPIP